MQVMRLTALQLLGRDFRTMLRKLGSVAVHLFPQAYQDHFSVELKPALYGYPDSSSLVRVLPHFVKLAGRPGLKRVEISPILGLTTGKKCCLFLALKILCKN